MTQRPNAEELLKGIQRSLMTSVMPEVQSDHGRAEVIFSNLMLNVVVRGLDGAAQTLVDDNAALRELAARGAEDLSSANVEPELAAELRGLAEGSDGARDRASLRLTDSSKANAELTSAVARLAVVAEAREELAELRGVVLAGLRSRAERSSYSMLGPRADG